jgi:hypothetical protein
MDGRSFAEVQCPALQRYSVGGTSHFAAQCVDFIDEMAFAGSADCGIAGHVRDSVEVYSKQQRAQSQPGGSESSLYSGVTRAYYRHIGFTGKKAAVTADRLTVRIMFGFH